MNRIEKKFAKLKAEDRKGLVTFVTAGDPDRATSQTILNSLPEGGADFIEIGMPFSDPMADGPAIQEASIRALKGGMTLAATLEMVREFRKADGETPLILMGYFNPIYQYGIENFVRDGAKAGIDGMIIVDLPPEEDDELRIPAREAGIDMIRLVTPTTRGERLNKVVDHASGFLYYVSITGVTGTRSADVGNVAAHIEDIRKISDLPVAAGFGIRTPEDARKMAQAADAVVVGSAIVKNIAALEEGGKTMDDISSQVKELAAAL